MREAALAVLVGVVAAIVTVLTGLLVSEFGSPEVGGFIQSISWLVGLIAGLWYFFARSGRL